MDGLGSCEMDQPLIITEAHMSFKLEKLQNIRPKKLSGRGWCHKLRRGLQEIFIDKILRQCPPCQSRW